MKYDNKIHRFLSMIHLIFITSLFLNIMTVISFGILFLPALTAVFHIGKELIYGRYNVYDALVMTLMKKMVVYRKMLKFIPVQFILVLQWIGFYVAGMQQLFFIQIILLCTSGVLMTYIVYLSGYEVFITGKYNWYHVIFAMLYKVNYFISLWIFNMIMLVFSNLNSIKYLCVTNSLILLVIEVVVLLSFIKFKYENTNLCKALVLPKWMNESSPKKHLK